MDDDSNELLRQLVNGQKEQTDLLRKNLWRLRFSLFGLLILMTFIGIALGVGIYLTKPKASPWTPIAIPSSPAVITEVYSRGRFVVPDQPAADPFK